MLNGNLTWTSIHIHARPSTTAQATRDERSQPKTLEYRRVQWHTGYYGAIIAHILWNVFPEIDAAVFYELRQCKLPLYLHNLRYHSKLEFHRPLIPDAA